tara:strand:+ start:90 stop:371 length:282 start_codon:yes stop_codon:yes gene_type:complete
MSPAEQRTLQEVSAKVEFLEEKIIDSLETMKETQGRICGDISKIKEAVYNPDQGLYARIRTLEEESKSRGKVLWLLFSVGLGAIGTAIISHLQ